jgi:hypothetical protein
MQKPRLCYRPNKTKWAFAHLAPHAFREGLIPRVRLPVVAAAAFFLGNWRFAAFLYFLRRLRLRARVLPQRAVLSAQCPVRSALLPRTSTASSAL